MPSLSPPPRQFSTFSVKNGNSSLTLKSSNTILPPVVLLIVLGDIGHSPRMVQHIQELLRNGYEVNCIAYLESSMPESLSASHRFHFYPLSLYSSIQNKRGLLLLFFTIYKVISQIFTLIWIMLFRIHSSPKYIITQNPPCIPLFMMLPIISWLYRARWIIDWHNLSWSIMSMSHGQNSILMKTCRWIEYSFGLHAHGHICVTNAMKKDLILHGISNTNITVCYDHPSKYFRRSSIDEIHELFVRVTSKYKSTLAKFLPDASSNWTPFTKSTPETSPICDSPASRSNNNFAHIKLRIDRPALIISSTSWTIDENFDLLLEAIDSIEKSLSISKSRQFPNAIVIITGKGPMKQIFMEKYSTKNWKKFVIICDWFESKDYSKLLGSADIGISFHSSSSGLDFPMKVVDMLGSDLPALALDFPCITELVHHNVNGLLFKDSNELSLHMTRLLDSFPENEELQRLHRQCEQEILWEDSWSEHWSKRVKPMFKTDCRLDYSKK